LDSPGQLDPRDAKISIERLLHWQRSLEPVLREIGLGKSLAGGGLSLDLAPRSG
jgi:hypothetical protein